MILWSLMSPLQVMKRPLLRLCITSVVLSVSWPENIALATVVCIILELVYGSASHAGLSSSRASHVALSSVDLGSH